MPDPRTWEIAQALKGVLVAAFAAAEREHKRNYISDGGVVWDWEPLFAVEWVRTEPAYAEDGSEGGLNPAQMGGGFLALRSVYNVHVTRRSPFNDEAGTSPQPAKIETAALINHQDAELIINTLCGGMGDDTLLGTCGRATFISQMAVGVDGGTTGSVTTVAVPW